MNAFVIEISDKFRPSFLPQVFRTSVITHGFRRYYCTDIHWHVTRDILAGLMSNGAYRNEPAATWLASEDRLQLAWILTKHEGVLRLDTLSLDTCTRFARS